MFDPISDLLRSLDATRSYHGIQRPHDGELYLQRADTLIAMTAWAEARGETRLGMLLILCVVRNRVAQSPRFGVGWPGVVLRPKQFSCWNAPKIARATLAGTFARGSGPDFDAWSIACGATFDVMQNRCPDLSGGADHYFAPGGMVNGKPPSWAKSMTPTVTYRGHLFFRGE